MNLSINFSSKHPVLPFAASELKNYLLKLNSNFLVSENQTESKYRIFLTVDPSISDGGNTQLDDCYRIEVQDLVGSIIGVNPRSVLLGIYKYLWLLGCRFLRPGKEYELIPSIIEIEDFNASYSAVASLRHRGVCIEGADSLENIKEFIDWLPKLGFNSFFVQFEIPFVFMKQWYQHKNNPSLKEEAFSMATAEEYSAVIDAEMLRRGLLHHRVGHGWTSAVLLESALGWVASDRPLSEEVRPLTALINGKREYFGGIPINTNLCYSNPEVIASFVKHVIDYSKLHSDVDYLHIWLADAVNNHCECDRCNKKLPTDHYIHLLNCIDEALTAEGLDTKIVFLLYHELLWPAASESLNHPERFLLMFAPITRTFNHSFSERGELAPIPEFELNRVKMPNCLEANLSFLEAWQKTFTGDSFDYDYPLGRAHYGDLGYVSISKILYADIHELKNLSLNGYMSCQELRSFLPNGLPNYVMGMALFDTSLSFEEIEDDYFKHAYGEEWKIVQAYLEKLSALCSCDYFNRIGSRIDPNVSENMLNALNLVNQFKTEFSTKQTSKNPVTEQFFKHLDYHADYSIRLMKALYELSCGNEEAAKTSFYEFLHYIQQHELEFQKSLDVFRVTEVATHYAGFPPEKSNV